MLLLPELRRCPLPQVLTLSTMMLYHSQGVPESSPSHPKPSWWGRAKGRVQPSFPSMSTPTTRILHFCHNSIVWSLAVQEHIDAQKVEKCGGFRWPVVQKNGSAGTKKEGRVNARGQIAITGLREERKLRFLSWAWGWWERISSAPTGKDMETSFVHNW